MKIISLSGKKGSGKDTAADIIEEILGKENVNRCAFADKLKRVCMEVFGLDHDQVHGERKEERFAKDSVWLEMGHQQKILEAFDLNPCKSSSRYIVELLSPRYILQYVGTNFLRSFDNKIHLRGLPLDRHKGITNVVTDARFLDELAFLNEKAPFNFIPLYINRDSAPRTDGHDSEKLTPEDYPFEVIENNGTFEELRWMIESAIA